MDSALVLFMGLGKGSEDIFSHKTLMIDFPEWSIVDGHLLIPPPYPLY